MRWRLMKRYISKRNNVLKPSVITALVKMQDRVPPSHGGGVGNTPTSQAYSERLIRALMQTMIRECRTSITICDGGSASPCAF
jgi:predicted unusual protein kinase regulating ubiquinone biosynthesis (AarF/ABC1/UbiB family)